MTVTIIQPDDFLSKQFYHRYCPPSLVSLYDKCTADQRIRVLNWQDMLCEVQ